MKPMLVLAALALLAACEALPQAEQTVAAGTLTEDHYRRTANLRDDDLDPIATITTADGYRPRFGAFDKSWNDNFLRAFINKRTGRTTYQVYQHIFYHGYDMRRYYTASYAGRDGPRAAAVTVIDRDITCGSWRDRVCGYDEIIGFDVDEALLRAIAARQPPGRGLSWRFKFRARSGDEFATGLAPAEVAGLLQRVDAYKARRGLR